MVDGPPLATNTDTAAFVTKTSNTILALDSGIVGVELCTQEESKFLSKICASHHRLIRDYDDHMLVSSLQRGQVLKLLHVTQVVGGFRAGNEDLEFGSGRTECLFLSWGKVRNARMIV